MSLVENVNSAIKSAMLSKDDVRLRGLRAIKAAIQLALTEPGAGKDLGEEKEIQILQKLLKQRKDSITIFEQQNRADLSAKELEEVQVIQEFLPAQMNEDELTKAIQLIIQESGASGIKEMGKVIGLANKAFAGKAEGSLIAQIVKKLLSE